MKERASLIWRSAAQLVEDALSKLLGNNMLFLDRHDAGKQLAERLRALKEANPVVLALPRGGVLKWPPRHASAMPQPANPEGLRAALRSRS